jgi:hypothetical protein
MIQEMMANLFSGGGGSGGNPLLQLGAGNAKSSSGEDLD